MPNLERGSKIDLHGLDIGIAIVEDSIKRALSYGRNTAYLCRQYSPSSRPMPDCLKPPNGTVGWKVL